MTDPRTERFERELRAVLHEPTGGPVPAAIGELLGRLPDAEPVRGRTVFARWFGGPPVARPDRRNVLALGGLGALAVAVIVVAVVGGPLLRGLGSGGFGAGAGASPTSGAGATPRFRWDSGSAIMTMVDGRIIANGQVFLVDPGGIHVSADPGSETYQTLELTWKEHEREMRMNLYFSADERSWWVDELRTYNGAANGDWLYYRGPLFRTPLGQSFLGDIDLATADGHGRIRFMGALIEAFRPGRVRLDPVNCKPVVPPAPVHPDPMEPGQPLAGSGLDQMPPAKAEIWLRDQGICASWRFEYATSDDGVTGYGEVWCTAPPQSRITGVAYDSDGDLIVFTEPTDGRVRPPPIRPQPAPGWNC